MNAEGVESLSRSVSESMFEVEESVDAALDAAAAITGALGTLGGVRATFEGAADPRRRTGPDLVAYARATLNAVQEGTIAFIEADDTMTESTRAAQAASRLTPTHYSWQRFGQAPS